MDTHFSIVFITLLQTQVIFSQFNTLQKNGGYQNVPANLPQANFNKLPAGNNLPTTNTLPFISSLPDENNVPVNRLQLLTGLPFINGFVNDVASNNGLLQNNLLQTTNELPAVNNILSNNLPTIGSLPMPNNSPNILQPVASNLPINPLGNTLILGSNLANNGFSLNNGLTNNCNPAAMFNSGLMNVNGVGNMQHFNNLPNATPKVSKNLLPNELISKSGIPLLNNNFLKSLIENNANINDKQSAPINIELQFGSVMPNNLQVTNRLPNNGLPFSPQLTNSFPLNIPAPIPIGENLPVRGIPTCNGPLNALVANNFNRIQPENLPPIANNLQLPFNNGGQYSNVASINSISDYQNNLLNGGQSLFLNLPASELPASNLPINNLPVNNMPVNNSPVNNLPVNNFLPDNLAGYNLPLNSVGCGSGLPFNNDYNVPSSLPNINWLNLSELGNLPIFSGLPVIGVTETVTVINTAPSLYL